MNILNLKKGLSLKFFGKISEGILKECKENDIDCIELSFPLEYFNEIDFINNSRNIKEMADNVGIEIWSIHLPYGKSVDISSLNDNERNNGISFYSNLIKSASSIGIKIAVVHPSYEPIKDEERTLRIQRSRESISILSQVCKEYNMNLAVEDLPRSCLGNCSEELIKLVKDNSNAGICFDTNHSTNEDNIYFLNNILKNCISIYTLHISDYDFLDEKHMLPGDGINKWNDILDILEKIDYNGPLMYEVNAKPLERDEIKLEQIKENQYKLIHRML